MPHIPRLFCGCGFEMTIEKNGMTLNVHTSDGNPYYLIQSDKWRCKRCQMVAYIPAQQEFAIHIAPDFEEQAAKSEAFSVVLAN